jgi:hypothetical protein
VDLAVLTLSESVPGVESMRYGRVDRGVPVRFDDFIAVGFPKWARDNQDIYRTAQVGGSVLTAEGLRTRTQGGSDGQLLRLESRRPPGRPISTGMVDDVSTSPWAGMSGAAVVVGDVVIGVIHSHNRAGGDRSLTVTPLTALKLLGQRERQVFCDALGLRTIDDLTDLNGDDNRIRQAAVPAVRTQEFCSEVRDHYEKKLAKLGLSAPGRWDQQELDRLRDECERDVRDVHATADLPRTADLLQAVELLKTLCVAVRALPILRQIGGREVGITRLQYLYLRHVGRWPDWPDRNNPEGMLILAASAGETERHRARSEPGYQLPDKLTALARFMIGVAGHSKDSLAETLADPDMRGLKAWVTEAPLEHQVSDARRYLKEKVGGKTWVIIELKAPESAAREWPTRIVVDAVTEGASSSDVKTRHFPCAATSKDQLEDALRDVVKRCLPAGEAFVDLFLPLHLLGAGIEHWDVVRVGLGYRSMIENNHRPHLRWAVQRHDAILLDLMRRRCRGIAWTDRPLDIPPHITSDPARFSEWLGERDRKGTSHPPFFIGSSHGAENHDPLRYMLDDGYGFIVWFKQEPTPAILRAIMSAADDLTEQQRQDNLPSVLAATAGLRDQWPCIIWSNPDEREDFRLPQRRASAARRGR